MQLNCKLIKTFVWGEKKDRKFWLALYFDSTPFTECLEEIQLHFSFFITQGFYLGIENNYQCKTAQPYRYIFILLKKPKASNYVITLLSSLMRRCNIWGIDDPKAGCGHSTGMGVLFSTAVWVSLPGQPPPPGFTAAWLCETKAGAKLSTIKGRQGCQDKSVTKWENAEEAASYHTHRNKEIKEVNWRVMPTNLTLRSRFWDDKKTHVFK